MKKNSKNVENTAVVESVKASAKSPKAKTAKVEKTPSVRSTLRESFPTLVTAQIRILFALDKAKNALHDAAIVERSGIRKNHLTGFAFKTFANKKTPALAEQGLIKVSEIEVAGRKCRGAVLTAKGKQIVERLQKAGAK